MLSLSINQKTISNREKMSILPKEIQEKTLANGKTIRIYRYSDGRIVHRLWDAQILEWKRGYGGPCCQYRNEYALVYGDRLDAFTGTIDPETHEFQGSVLTLWPRSVNVIELETDKNNFIDILHYASGRVVHIDMLGKVFDWPTGYDGPCSEYTDVKTYNDSPSKDIFTGAVDPMTHLRQGFGKRRYFNDPDAPPMPNGWLNRRHESLNYMFIGHFVDGEIAGEGTMIYINNSAHRGTFDKYGIRKIHPVAYETMYENHATKANTVNILSCPSVILPPNIRFDNDRGADILEYHDGRVLTISAKGTRTFSKASKYQ